MLRTVTTVLLLALSQPLWAQEIPTNGQEGLYVGQVFLSVTMTFPAGMLDTLTDEQKAQLGEEVESEGDKIIGKPAPLAGAVVRLGDLTSFSDREGYFSFNSIPDGVSTGEIFQQYGDTRPIGTFSVSMLVKKGEGAVTPIVLHFEKTAEDHLRAME